MTVQKVQYNQSNRDSLNNPYSYRGEKSFHVSLVRPPMVSFLKTINTAPVTPPLALACLSSALRDAGFSFTNIDSIGEGLDSNYALKHNPSMGAAGLTFEEIAKRVPPETSLIGVSCMFSLEWPTTKRIVQFLKSRFPNTPIIAGGEHVSALSEFSMEDCPELDYICLGEGDKVLVNVANCLSRGEPIEHLTGIVSRSDEGVKRQLKDEVRVTSLDTIQKFKKADLGDAKTYQKPNISGASGERILDLSTLKWPAWDLLPINNYLDAKMSFGRYVGRTMPLMASRGCPYECTFCSNPLMWGRRYQTRDVKDVVDEIIFYRDRYGITAVEFYDLTPIIKKEWILDFCKELIDRDVQVSWQISGGTRCEAIDEEVIRLGKQAGLQYLGFAPESGDKDVLKRIKKRVNLDHMMKLLKIARKYGVQTRCNIVIGFPEDKRVQVYKSLLFQLKLAYYGVVDAPIFEFVPYPGSQLFNQLRKDGVISELNDAYFEGLGQRVGLLSAPRFCKQMGPIELTIYRISGMMLFYSLYYLLRPKKIYHFVKNVFSYSVSNSVFEQRVIYTVRKKLGLTSKAQSTEN